jgi:hypothetical protein
LEWLTHTTSGVFQISGDVTVGSTAIRAADSEVQGGPLAHYFISGDVTVGSTAIRAADSEVQGGPLAHYFGTFRFNDLLNQTKTKYTKQNYIPYSYYSLST